MIAINIKLKNGDINALEQLYDSLNKRLYIFITRIINNKEVAEDIVQSTFIKVWDNREKLSLEKPLDAQIYVIARNLLLNYIKRKGIEKQVIEKLSRVENSMYDGINQVSFNETVNLYENAVEQLPTKRRQIYKLSNFEGLSNKEIAQKLSISSNTVENHLSKANVFIRGNLKFLKETILILL